MQFDAITKALDEIRQRLAGRHETSAEAFLTRRVVFSRTTGKGRHTLDITRSALDGVALVRHHKGHPEAWAALTLIVLDGLTRACSYAPADPALPYDEETNSRGPFPASDVAVWAARMLVEMQEQFEAGDGTLDRDTIAKSSWAPFVTAERSEAPSEARAPEAPGSVYGRPSTEHPTKGTGERSPVTPGSGAAVEKGE